MRSKSELEPPSQRINLQGLAEEDSSLPTVTENHVNNSQLGRENKNQRNSSQLDQIPLPKYAEIIPHVIFRKYLQEVPAAPGEISRDIFLNFQINKFFAKLLLKDSFTYPVGQTLLPPSRKSRCWAAGWSQWHRLARAVDEEDFTGYGNLFLLCGAYLTITAGLAAIFPSFVLMQTLTRRHRD